jgi:hypothetical protein
MTIYLFLIFLGILGIMALLAVSLGVIGYFSYIFFMETSYLEIKAYSWLNKKIADYICSLTNVKDNLHVTYMGNELDIKKQYIFALHPHGLAATSRFLHTVNKNSKLYPFFANTYQGAHSFLFRMPVIREFLLFAKCIPIYEKFLKKVIEWGHSISLYPGGAKEIQYTSENIDKHTDYYYLKNRSGFIRIALETGVPIVPIIFWKEQDCLTHSYFKLFDNINKVSKWLFGYYIDLHCFQIFMYENIKKVKNMLYNDDNRYIYVGKPILFTNESVEEAHAIYIEKLKELFEFANSKHGNVRKLIIE